MQERGDTALFNFLADGVEVRFRMFLVVLNDHVAAIMFADQQGSEFVA